MATITDIISAGQKNRCVYTEDFTQAGSWLQTGTLAFVANDGATLDPLGTSQADRINDTDAGVISSIRQSLSLVELTVNRYYTFSVYLKPDTTAQSSLVLQHYVNTTPGDSVTARIDWTTLGVTKVLGGTFAFSDVDIRASANGFYRISVTSIWKAGTNTALRAFIQPASTAASSSGAVWAWGAQLEAGAFATSYLAITGSNDGTPTSPDTGVRFYRIEDWYASLTDIGTDVRIGKLFDETYNLPANTIVFNRTGTNNTTKFTRLEPFGANEVNTITANAIPATAGVFTLTVNGQTTTNIARDTAATGTGSVQEKLEALSNVAPGDVICVPTAGANLGVSGAIITLNWQGAFAAQGVTISMNTLSLVGNAHVLGTSVEGGQGYDPVANTGPKIVLRWPTSGTNFAFKIIESSVKITGIGFFGDHQGRGQAASLAANGNEPEPVGNTMVWIDNASATNRGSDNTITSCFVSLERGGGDISGGSDHIFKAFYIGSSRGDITADTTKKAIRNAFFNCIVKGAGPRSLRGADFGWYWGAFAESASNGTIVVGGCYNCVAYGVTGHNLGKGFWGNQSLPRVEFSPELLNCVAIDCDAGFSGFWRKGRYSVTSDYAAPVEWDQIPSSTGLNNDPLVAATNKTGIGADSAFINPLGQDFRQRGGSPLVDAGLNLNSIFTGANGPGNSNDFDRGASRPTTAQTWDIGAYEGVVVVPTTTVTTVTKTVGRGISRDYPSIGALIADLPRSLVYLRHRWAATCYDDGVVDVVGNTIELQHFNCVASPTHNLEIKADKNINPRTQRGYVCQIAQQTDVNTYHRALLWVTMPFLRLSGIMLRQAATSAATVNARVLELYAHDCVVDSVFFLFNDATYTTANSTTACMDLDGDRNIITNCVFRGADTVGKGPPVGLGVEPDVKDNHILHCIAYRNRGGTGTSSARGIVVRAGSTDNRVSGCVALETATAGSGGAADFGVGAGMVKEVIIDHCFASDTTPGNGAGCVSSLTASQIFNNAPINDYRLQSTSLALNAGDKLGALFTADIAGTARAGPFDVGIYEGIITGPLLATPAPRDHHRFVTLWEVQRNDGFTHFFCSANEPIVHLGQTYKAVGQTQDHARRMESALKEHNTELIGAIVSVEITAEALAAGLYSNARLVERLVDWRYPWTTPTRTAVYYVSSLDFDQDVWRADLVGPTVKLDLNIGELIGLDCEYDLGDDDCQFNIKSVTQTNISISSVVDARREFVASSLTGTGVTTDDYFGRGKLTMLSGQNAGLVFEVKTYTGVAAGPIAAKTIRLVEKAPFPFAVNDKFNLSPGCRLRYLRDCIAKYNNGINFGGRPWLEGPDLLFETPTR